MGRIGMALAKRASAFDMQIIYHNRKRLDADAEQRYNCRYVSFAELLQTSDYISVHTPLTPDTKHLLDKPQFDMMKRGVYIINTARGPIIREQALVDALYDGRVGGAGLDVFEEEPRVHPGLMSHPCVTLVPHIGTATEDTRQNMARHTMDNVRVYCETGTPLTPVNSIPEQ
eukprot:TRINITY_DN549_c0_g1_i3.p1 TRINITY_DN549_c0_g1~~TRINITY_DN549_c0_g1_i3.p1  ORF type:complete len:172 (-),score=29.16 TRINITY_DN549_c0_g1_i3:29-544(-)